MSGPSIDKWCDDEPVTPWWFRLLWWVFVVAVLVLIGYAYCTG